MKKKTNRKRIGKNTAETSFWNSIINRLPSVGGLYSDSQKIEVDAQKLPSYQLGVWAKSIALMMSLIADPVGSVLSPQSLFILEKQLSERPNKGPLTTLLSYCTTAATWYSKTTDNVVWKTLSVATAIVSKLAEQSGKPISDEHKAMLLQWSYLAYKQGFTDDGISLKSAQPFPGEDITCYEARVADAMGSLCSFEDSLSGHLGFGKMGAANQEKYLSLLHLSLDPSTWNVKLMAEVLGFGLGYDTSDPSMIQPFYPDLEGAPTLERLKSVMPESLAKVPGFVTSWTDWAVDIGKQITLGEPPSEEEVFFDTNTSLTELGEDDTVEIQSLFSSIQLNPSAFVASMVGGSLIVQSGLNGNVPKAWTIPAGLAIVSAFVQPVEAKAVQTLESENHVKINPSHLQPLNLTHLSNAEIEEIAANVLAFPMVDGTELAGGPSATVDKILGDHIWHQAELLPADSKEKAILKDLLTPWTYQPEIDDLPELKKAEKSTRLYKKNPMGIVDLRITLQNSIEDYFTNDIGDHKLSDTTEKFKVLMGRLFKEDELKIKENAVTNGFYSQQEFQALLDKLNHPEQLSDFQTLLFWIAAKDTTVSSDIDLTNPTTVVQFRDLIDMTEKEFKSTIKGGARQSRSATLQTHIDAALNSLCDAGSDQLTAIAWTNKHPMIRSFDLDKLPEDLQFPFLQDVFEAEKEVFDYVDRRVDYLKQLPVGEGKVFDIVVNNPSAHHTAKLIVTKQASTYDITYIDSNGIGYNPVEIAGEKVQGPQTMTMVMEGYTEDELRTVLELVAYNEIASIEAVNENRPYLYGNIRIPIYHGSWKFKEGIKEIGGKRVRGLESPARKPQLDGNCFALGSIATANHGIWIRNQQFEVKKFPPLAERIEWTFKYQLFLSWFERETGVKAFEAGSSLHSESSLTDTKRALLSEGLDNLMRETYQLSEIVLDRSGMVAVDAQLKGIAAYLELPTGITLCREDTGLKQPKGLKEEDLLNLIDKAPVQLIGTEFSGQSYNPIQFTIAQPLAGAARFSIDDIVQPINDPKRSEHLVNPELVEINLPAARQWIEAQSLDTPVEHLLGNQSAAHVIELLSESAKVFALEGPGESNVNHVLYSQELEQYVPVFAYQSQTEFLDRTPASLNQLVTTETGVGYTDTAARFGIVFKAMALIDKILRHQYPEEFDGFGFDLRTTDNRYGITDFISRLPLSNTQTRSHFNDVLAYQAQISGDKILGEAYNVRAVPKDPSKARSMVMSLPEAEFTKRFEHKMDPNDSEAYKASRTEQETKYPSQHFRYLNKYYSRGIAGEKISMSPRKTTLTEDARINCLPFPFEVRRWIELIPTVQLMVQKLTKSEAGTKNDEGFTQSELLSVGYHRHLLAEENLNVATEATFNLNHLSPGDNSRKTLSFAQDPKDHLVVAEAFFDEKSENSIQLSQATRPQKTGRAAIVGALSELNDAIGIDITTQDESTKDLDRVANLLSVLDKTRISGGKAFTQFEAVLRRESELGGNAASLSIGITSSLMSTLNKVWILERYDLAMLTLEKVAWAKYQLKSLVKDGVVDKAALLDLEGKLQRFRYLTAKAHATKASSESVQKANQRLALFSQALAPKTDADLLAVFQLPLATNQNPVSERLYNHLRVYLATLVQEDVQRYLDTASPQDIAKAMAKVNIITLPYSVSWSDLLEVERVDSETFLYPYIPAELKGNLQEKLLSRLYTSKVPSHIFDQYQFVQVGPNKGLLERGYSSNISASAIDWDSQDKAGYRTGTVDIRPFIESSSIGDFHSEADRTIVTSDNTLENLQEPLHLSLDSNSQVLPQHESPEIAKVKDDSYLVRVMEQPLTHPKFFFKFKGEGNPAFGISMDPNANSVFIPNSVSDTHQFQYQVDYKDTLLQENTLGSLLKDTLSSKDQVKQFIQLHGLDKDLQLHPKRLGESFGPTVWVSENEEFGLLLENGSPEILKKMTLFEGQAPVWCKSIDKADISKFNDQHPYLGTLPYAFYYAINPDPDIAGDIRIFGFDGGNTPRIELTTDVWILDAKGKRIERHVPCADHEVGHQLGIDTSYHAIYIPIDAEHPSEFVSTTLGLHFIVKVLDDGSYKLLSKEYPGYYIDTETKNLSKNFPWVINLKSENPNSDTPNILLTRSISWMIHFDDYDKPMGRRVQLSPNLLQIPLDREGLPITLELTQEERLTAVKLFLASHHYAIAYQLLEDAHQDTPFSEPELRIIDNIFNTETKHYSHPHVGRIQQRLIDLFNESQQFFPIDPKDTTRQKIKEHISRGVGRININRWKALRDPYRINAIFYTKNRNFESEPVQQEHDYISQEADKPHEPLAWLKPLFSVEFKPKKEVADDFISKVPPSASSASRQQVWDYQDSANRYANQSMPVYTRALASTPEDFSSARSKFVSKHAQLQRQIFGPRGYHETILLMANEGILQGELSQESVMPVTIPKLIRAYVSGDVAEYKALNPHLDREKCLALSRTLTTYMQHFVELKQFERLMSAWKSHRLLDSHIQKVGELVYQDAPFAEIENPNNPITEGSDPASFRLFTAREFLSTFVMWNEQAKVTHDMTDLNRELRQVRTGGGKSSMITMNVLASTLPIEWKDREKHFILNIVPDDLFEQSHSYLRQQLAAYEMNVLTLSVSGEEDLSLEDLQERLYKLRDLKGGNGVLLMTATQDKVYQASVFKCYADMKLAKTEEERAQHAKRAEVAKAIVDELASAQRILDEVDHLAKGEALKLAKGNAIAIEKGYIDASKHLFTNLTEDPKIRQLCRRNPGKIKRIENDAGRTVSLQIASAEFYDSNLKPLVVDAVFKDIKQRMPMLDESQLALVHDALAGTLTGSANFPNTKGHDNPALEPGEWLFSQNNASATFMATSPSLKRVKARHASDMPGNIQYLNFLRQLHRKHPNAAAQIASSVELVDTQLRNILTEKPGVQFGPYYKAGDNEIDFAVPYQDIDEPFGPNTFFSGMLGTVIRTIKQNRELDLPAKKREEIFTMLSPNPSQKSGYLNQLKKNILISLIGDDAHDIWADMMTYQQLSNSKEKENLYEHISTALLQYPEVCDYFSQHALQTQYIAREEIIKVPGMIPVDPGFKGQGRHVGFSATHAEEEYPIDFHLKAAPESEHVLSLFGNDENVKELKGTSSNELLSRFAVAVKERNRCTLEDGTGIIKGSGLDAAKTLMQKLKAKGIRDRFIVYVSDEEFESRGIKVGSLVRLMPDSDLPTNDFTVMNTDKQICLLRSWDNTGVNPPGKCKAPVFVSSKSPNKLQYTGQMSGRSRDLNLQVANEVQASEKDRARNEVWAIPEEAAAARAMLNLPEDQPITQRDLLVYMMMSDGDTRKMNMPYVLHKHIEFALYRRAKEVLWAKPTAETTLSQLEDEALSVVVSKHKEHPIEAYGHRGRETDFDTHLSLYLVQLQQNYPSLVDKPLMDEIHGIAGHLKQRFKHMFPDKMPKVNSEEQGVEQVTVKQQDQNQDKDLTQEKTHSKQMDKRQAMATKPAEEPTWDKQLLFTSSLDTLKTEGPKLISLASHFDNEIDFFQPNLYMSTAYAKTTRDANIEKEPDMVLKQPIGVLEHLDDAGNTKAMTLISMTEYDDIRETIAQNPHKATHLATRLLTPELWSTREGGLSIKKTTPDWDIYTQLKFLAGPHDMTLDEIKVLQQHHTKNPEGLRKFILSIARFHYDKPELGPWELFLQNSVEVGL